MDKTVKKAYMRGFCSAKKPVARISDMILGTILVFIAAALVFRELGASGVAASLCGAWTAALFTIGTAFFRTAAFDRYVKRERACAVREDFCEKLLMCTEAEFRSIAEKEARDSCDRLFLHQSQKSIDADEILAVYRAAKADGVKSAAIFTIGVPDDDAVRILSRISDIRIEIVRADSSFETCNIPEDKADALYLRRHSEANKPLRERLRISGRPAGYLICGAALFLMSFVMHYSLYYRTVGTICLWVSAYLYFGKSA